MTLHARHRIEPSLAEGLHLSVFQEFRMQRIRLLAICGLFYTVVVGIANFHNWGYWVAEARSQRSSTLAVATFEDSPRPLKNGDLAEERGRVARNQGLSLFISGIFHFGVLILTLRHQSRIAAAE